MTRAAQQRARDLAEADWRWLVAAPSGRRIMADLIRQCGLLEPTFSDAPLRSAYAEGKRAIGHLIYTRLTSVAEGADLPALLAEVMAPPNVRRSNPAAGSRDDRDGDADPG